LSPNDLTTPLSRRFTDESTRSLAETRTTYETVRRFYLLSVWSKKNALSDASAVITAVVKENIILPNHPAFLDALDRCQQELLSFETQIFSPVEAEFSASFVLRDLIELNEQLRDRRFFFENESAILRQLVSAFTELTTVLTAALPTTQESPLTIPIISTLADPAATIEAILLSFFKPQYAEWRVFRALAATLYRNITAASGIKPGVETNKPLIFPTKAGEKALELLETYLADTPLYELFNAPYPFDLPAEQRFSGMWIIASHGRGKTTLLHTMVMHDLQKDACVILMDSKGELLAPFREMKSIQDRLVIIDPDPNNPIALNPLDIPITDIAQSVDFLEYLFGSLLKFEMTATQSALFRNVLRALITAFPNPTLDTLRTLLSSEWKIYNEHIKTLPERLRQFFYTEFDTENLRGRRKEINLRLDLLLDNDSLRAMLTAIKNRFKIADAMDTGKVVIINNSLDLLGDQGAEFLGRFFVTQIRAAGQARSGRRPEDKKPVYFYIDEAHDVIRRDEHIPKIIDQLRSQKVALILAHQRIEQIESKNVLSALSNCAIRFGNSDVDAGYVAKALRTDPEFVNTLSRGKFAAFVRDITTTAIAVSVPQTDFSKHPKLTNADKNALKEKMRTQYGVPITNTSASEPAPKPVAGPVPARPSTPATTKQTPRDRVSQGRTSTAIPPLSQPSSSQATPTPPAAPPPHPTKAPFPEPPLIDEADKW
jgi:hypothetical protein